jgi:hypothetical protein
MDLEQAQLALSEANGRIADLEGQVTALTGERDAVTGRATELEAAQAALDARLAETTGAHAVVSADLAEAQLALSASNGRGLTHLRRALLAEHTGQVVPELVSGDDEEALLASVDVAKQAYTRALDAARTAIASQTVPAGAPSARTTPAAGLSPLEMIESGLRR